LAEGQIPAKAKIGQVLAFAGLERVPVLSAEAGDIVLITGVDDITIGTTLASVEMPEALPPISVDLPTLSMYFQVNTSPLAGRDGKYVTSRNLRDRLAKEILTNVALRVEETGDTDAFLVSGRGELHLTILIENMRREGYELAASRPRVVLRQIDGVTCEPYEALSVDVEEIHQGAVMEALGPRRGDLTNMESDARGRVRPRIPDPGAGLIGFQGEFMNLTRGTGPHEPCVRRLRATEGRYSRSPQRCADLGGRRRGGCLCVMETAGARPDVRVAGRQGLRRHDHRYPQP
jgi:GTP-binding protein